MKPIHTLKKTFDADGTQYRIYQLTAVSHDPQRRPVWCEIVNSAEQRRTFLLFGTTGGWRSTAAPAAQPKHTRCFADDVNSGAIGLS